jgi:hypothetical protein
MAALVVESVKARAVFPIVEEEPVLLVVAVDVAMRCLLSVLPAM